MLSLTEVLERDNRAEVNDAMHKVGSVEPRELMDMQLAAFEWANEITQEQAA